VVSFHQLKASAMGGIEVPGAGVGPRVGVGVGTGVGVGVGVTGGSSTSAIDVRDVLIERNDAAMFFRCSSVIGSAMIATLAAVDPDSENQQQRRHHHHDPCG
jgi:hypothetical protein